MTSVLGVALVLVLSGSTAAFVTRGYGASTHVSITREALLQIVTETCRDVVEAAGLEFEPMVGLEDKNVHTTRTLSRTKINTLTLISTYLCVSIQPEVQP